MGMVHYPPRGKRCIATSDPAEPHVPSRSFGDSPLSNSGVHRIRRTRSVIYCGDEGRRLFKEGR